MCQEVGVIGFHAARVIEHEHNVFGNVFGDVFGDVLGGVRGFHFRVVCAGHPGSIQKYCHE